MKRRWRGARAHAKHVATFIRGAGSCKLDVERWLRGDRGRKCVNATEICIKTQIPTRTPSIRRPSSTSGAAPDIEASVAIQGETASHTRATRRACFAMSQKGPGQFSTSLLRWRLQTLPIRIQSGRMTKSGRVQQQQQQRRTSLARLVYVYMVYGEYYNNSGINGEKERRNPGKERR